MIAGEKEFFLQALFNAGRGAGGAFLVTNVSPRQGDSVVGVRMPLQAEQVVRFAIIDSLLKVA